MSQIVNVNGISQTSSQVKAVSSKMMQKENTTCITHEKGNLRFQK